MWANDFSWRSHASHFSALPENPKKALSTGRLCHITPSGSGTWPSFFLLYRFAIAPKRPVISALGIRCASSCRPPGLDGFGIETPGVGGL